MGRLEGKIAFITGAGSGIARSAAKVFAREGARVIVAEINSTLGSAAALEAGKNSIFIPTDVRDESSVALAIKETIKQFGGLHILFNCAGGSVVEDGKVTDVNMDVWEQTIPLDLKGPFICCRYAIPEIIKSGGGTVINVSSVVALRGNHPAHVYSSAKGALISLTRALAGSYSTDGVRANVICPGLVKTDRIKERYVAVKPDPEREDSVNTFESYPFGVGEPEDIANIALFLASDESRMINGAVIPAEGGISAY